MSGALPSRSFGRKSGSQRVTTSSRVEGPALEEGKGRRGDDRLGEGCEAENGVERHCDSGFPIEETGGNAKVGSARPAYDHDRPDDAPFGDGAIDHPLQPLSYIARVLSPTSAMKKRAASRPVVKDHRPGVEQRSLVLFCDRCSGRPRKCRPSQPRPRRR